MRFEFSQGLKVEVSGFCVRCGLCRQFFVKGDEVTFGTDLTVWTHKECWEKMSSPQQLYEYMVKSQLEALSLMEGEK